MSKEEMGGLELIKALDKLKDFIMDNEWCDAEYEFPLTDDIVLAVVNGKPEKNVVLEEAMMFAHYTREEGWVLDDYPEWKNFTVSHWKPLPELPEKSKAHIEEIFGEEGND